MTATVPTQPPAPTDDHTDTHSGEGDPVTGPSGPVAVRPEISAADLRTFVEHPPRLELHRLWFTKVKARWFTGHVQGVAAHIDGSGTTIYASLSDFPRGWGAALINDNRAYADGEPVGMEAMAFPQGRHPGGIAICEDYLAVPVEMDDLPGRVYIYGLDDPLYPRQVGHIDDLMDQRNGLWVDDPARKADNSKASAVGMTRLTGDTFLVVVLSQNRYLRFLHLRREVDPDSGDERLVGRQTGFVDGGADPDLGWPGGFTDNISLVRTDDGVHLVLFSIDQLASLGPLVIPRIRRRSIHGLTSFRIEPGTETDPAPRIANAGAGWVDLSKRLGPTDFLRPGFRWGASMGVFGGEPGLVTAEYFGNERSRDGRAQYLQFATNIPADRLGWNDIGDDVVRGVISRPVDAMARLVGR